MKEYALYDIKEFEQCICFGKLKEIANYLECTTSSLRSYLTRKKNKTQKLLKHRYEIVEIIENEEDIELIQEEKKTNKESLEELLKIFIINNQITTIEGEIEKFEIFDEFNWMIKSLKDRVIVDEEWKQIEDFNYSISNYGRLRNDKNGKIMSIRYTNWRLQGDIYKDGKKYTINIPRVEASLFIRKVLPEERVTYYDGDKRNNYYKNLKILSK